ncbi:MMPL family transporter [Salinicoccus kekensis]|uniref:RND superfamily putative drug exporter n=1 Tax=Salinicoccus kekensis TaxID=714307 RepID=A0A285UQB7_9STAP|nr:MMPL family transporter [Salinicoccus kekensis]SOC42836.1 RND superfamily putative drug exporter [Salinicoccus kekensis]
MKHILKFKWPVTVFMIAFAVLTYIFSPDLTQLAAEKGDVQLSDDQPSEQARQFLEKHGQDIEMMSLVLEFDGGVSENQQGIESYINELENFEDIDNIMNPFEFSEGIQENFINEDTGVMMIPMEYTGDENVILEAASDIEALNPTSAETSITSNELVQRTLEEDAMNGIQTTETFTVIIVLAVLLLMFRSVVTPLVPVLVVGVSYLIGQSFVAWFVEWLGFPISPQTQSFLIVILFGVGTDYCILLLNRFKEELLNNDKYQATLNTFKTGGKTVFISGISGAVVFGVLYFANFEIYRSAVGVAIGMLFMLLSIFTLLPILMSLLGKYIFWPSIKNIETKESRIWKLFGTFSIKHPTRIIFSVVAVLIVLSFFYNDEVSYDSISELDDSYSAVHATNVVSESFDEGVIFPIQVILSDGDDLVNDETMTRIESVADTVSKVDGVKEVQTVTRPTGDVIEELSVRYQLDEAESGMTEIAEGMEEMTGGLEEISGNLTEISEETGGADMGGGDLSELSAGLDELGEGVSGISQYMTMTGDVEGAAAQLEEVQAGMQEMATQVEAANEEMLAQQEAAATQMSELSDGLSEMASGIDEINDGMEETIDGMDEIQTLLSEITDNAAVDHTGVNVPQQFMESDELESAIDQYSFADDTAINLNVILDGDPYSHQAMDVLDEVEFTVNSELERLELSEVDSYFSGVTSMNRDLDQITTDDYTYVVTIFVITLFVILAVLFRSFILPIIMIGSIFVTYFASVSMTQWILGWFGIEQLNWAVPFFSLIIFAALGIDYSIFIIDRFREEVVTHSIKDAVEIAIRKMGSVVITAVIILSGTFAALYPSGIVILVQVTSIIIFALLFYAFVVLPLLVPALLVTFKRGNWWPFKMPGGEERHAKFKDEE